MEVDVIDECCPHDAWLRDLYRTWRAMGLDADRLFAQTGLTGEGAECDSPPVLSDRLSRLWELGVQSSGDPLLGLRSMPAQPLGSLGVLGHLIFACADLREVLSCLCRHLGTVLPTALVRLDERGSAARLYLQFTPGTRPVPPQRYDFVAMLVLRAVEGVAGRPLPPLALHHPSPRPAEAQRYTEMLRAPVGFGAPLAAMDFSAEALDAPLPTANPAVAEHCARLTVELEQARRGQLRTQVKRVLTEMLPKGDPRREEVAGALRISERTLQRRLADEGTHFQEIVDSTRRELAQHYLSAGRLSPKEMSFELGFADPSNFYRACKRWFGRPPRMLRDAS